MSLTVVFYISGHGFGHASRDLEVVHALCAIQPETRVVIRTSVPPSFFHVSAHVPVEVQSAATDTGVVQIDSLRLDEAETIRQAGAFCATFDARAGDEAQVLRDVHADMVIGDVPPLAFAAAARAGLPSILLGNFTWDWIYEGYPSFAREAPEAMAAIRDGYAQATRALRLPFHGGFDTVRGVTDDIPLIARQSQRVPSDTRTLLGLDRSKPTVLSSFGRYGLTLPYDGIAHDGAFTLIVTDHDRDPAASSPGADLKVVSRQDLLRLGLRYEDLVAAADVVVSKPGYGIVSECIANGASLLYTARGRFVEHDLLVREMPAVLRCRFIEQDDLLAGRWSDAVKGLLGQPRPRATLPVDGADVAARAILETAAAHDRRSPTRLEHA